MCRSVYSYDFCICLYVLNTFLALPKLSVFSTRDKGDKNYFCEYRNESQQVLANIGCLVQFLLLFVN